MIRTKNARKATVDLVKGKVKRSVGPLTRDDHLKPEGRVGQGVAKVEAAVGRRDRKTGHVIMQVGNVLNW
jgi:uncharacterized protein YjbJ (UPF0337 family)